MEAVSGLLIAGAVFDGALDQIATGKTIKRIEVNPSSAARGPQGELEAAATSDHRRRRATRKIEQRLSCSARIIFFEKLKKSIV